MLRLCSLGCVLASALALQAAAPASRRTRAAAAVITLDEQVISSPLEPLDNFLLVQVAAVVDSTKGGVLLPDATKERPTEGKVIACGPGRIHPDTGVLMPVSVVPGDKVLYGKYDGTSVKYCGADHQLIRDDDVLLAYSGAEMTLENVRPVRDRVLMKVEAAEESTASGIALAAGVADQSQTSIGEVVKIGDGRLSSAGTVTPMPVVIGESLKYRDYAGSDIKIEGEEYAVCRMVDCLAKC
ncbi:chaperonin 10-like protein [Pelagophyceae sp. CCMP2097]|nr:chaperonin 10-like protein [Pelagophyceae sp. CCMP2097]